MGQRDHCEVDTAPDNDGFLAQYTGDLTGGSNGLFLSFMAGDFGPLTAMTGSPDVFILSMLALVLIWLFVSRVLASPYGL
jgi:hypothetical protein